MMSDRTNQQIISQPTPSSLSSPPPKQVLCPYLQRQRVRRHGGNRGESSTAEEGKAGVGGRAAAVEQDELEAGLMF
jgi:hypothetical protein